MTPRDCGIVDRDVALWAAADGDDRLTDFVLFENLTVETELDEGREFQRSLAGDVHIRLRQQPHDLDQPSLATHGFRSLA